MRTALYYLGLSALFTHELDAVMRSEWRLLSFLRELPDASAYSWFVGLHFPAFAAILWLSHHRDRRVRAGFRLAVSLFLVVHAGLHFRLAGRPEYEFEGLLSNASIYAAAAFGLAWVALPLRERWAGRGGG